MQYSTELDILPEFLQAVTAKLRYEVEEEVAYGCRQVNAVRCHTWMSCVLMVWKLS